MWFKSAGSMSEMMRAVYVRMYLSLSEVGKTISERVTLADSFLRKIMELLPLTVDCSSRYVKLPDLFANASSINRRKRSNM